MLLFKSITPIIIPVYQLLTLPSFSILYMVWSQGLKKKKKKKQKGYSTFNNAKLGIIIILKLTGKQFYDTQS